VSLAWRFVFNMNGGALNERPFTDERYSFLYKHPIIRLHHPPSITIIRERMIVIEGG